jgi:formamidopyrimidine-DNA glycosylase
VEIKADDMILLIGTPIRYHAEAEKLPKKHQLLLEFEDFTAMSCTIQMWGAMFCFKDGENGGFSDYHKAKQTPSPLSEAFDRAFFDTLFDGNSGKLSAKAFLATEQRIPGLGNGVLQDILFNAKIHPKRKINTLSENDKTTLFNSIKSTLAEMTFQGGRDTERDLFGCPGGYRTILSKNTVGKPCSFCGTEIKKEAYLGGSIYYCGGCQKL